MEDKKKKKIITKETIIAAAIGLLIGAAVMFVIGWSLDYFAKSAGMARLKYGNDTIATVDGEKITTDTIYKKIKLTEGLGALVNEIDRVLLTNMYELTEKEEKQAKEEAEYYIEFYTAMGHTEEEFLEGNGFASYDEFLEEYRLSGLIKKYSDYIRYPIKMMVTKSRPKADNDKEFETYQEEER